MPDRRLILLLLNTELALTRQVFRGIADYARQAGNWELRLHALRRDDEPVVPEDRRPAGVIGHVTSRPAAGVLQASGLPWVNVSNYLFDPTWPVVTNHDRAVGRVAAGHLIERGFRAFGYVATDDAARSFCLRGAGFVEAIESAGHRCGLFPSSTPIKARDLPPRFQEWLLAQPKPLGLLARNDNHAGWVLEQCAAAGLSVPDDVAVVGVDNDDIWCEMASVTLSSVALGTHRIGHESAALLHQLMGGAAAPPDPVLVEPTGVVARRSSDVLAVPDPDVAAAMRHIGQHAGDPIGVQDVADAVALSRRALERRFRAALRRSVHDAIQRAHLERAMQLLGATDLTLPEVARRSGFKSRERLSVTFRQMTGTTPASYRRRFRGGA